MALQRLYSLDDVFPGRLDELLRDEKYVEELHALQDPELSQVVDHLDETVARLNRTGGSSRKCLQILRRICAKRKVLPSTFELSKELLPPDKPPKAQGGFCDAYEGTISIKVCIKRLRISTMESQQEKMKELFYKEAIVWKHLVHPNIVPFKGVTFGPLQLVSEWMPNGEIRHYARKPEADLVALLLGVANGLAYLHSCSVIHGDLKGSNIMVDEYGSARITDFGLTKLVRGTSSIPSTSDGQGESLRWTAPEILEHGGPATVESDIYSFGVVVIEVFTGEVPFKAVKSSEVVMRIINGERPKRPSHPTFTDNLWKLTQRCWAGQPKDRPKMEDVVKALTTGKLPDISPASPGATGSNLTMVSPGSNAGGMPPVSSSSKEEVRSYLLDDDNTGSDPSPPAPTKVGKDGNPTHTVVGRSTTVSSPGKTSGSDANGGLKSPGGGEGKGSGKLKTDEKSTTGVPSSVSQGPSSAVGQSKTHGMWCRVRHFFGCT